MKAVRTLDGSGAVRSVTLLVAGLVAGAALTFVARLLLARGLGPEGLGSFMAGLALVTIALPAATWGIGQLWMERHGEDPVTSSAWIRRGGAVAVATTATAVAATLLVAALVFGGTAALWVTVALTPLIAAAAGTQLWEALAQMAGRWRTVAGLSLLVPACLAAAGVAAMVGAGLTGASLTVTVLGGLMAVPLTIGVARRVRQRVADTTVRPGEILGRASPYALSAIVFTVYFYTDIVMLGSMRTAAEVGIYSAAVTLVAGAFLLPRAVFQMYLAPAKHVWVVHDQQRLRHTYLFATRLMLLIGVSGAAVGFVVAEPLMRFLFGSEFASGADAFRLLLLVIPLRFVSSACELILGTRDHARWRVRWQAIAAMGNIAVNVPMISTWGYRGAAISTVLTEAFVLIGFRWKSWRVHRTWR